MGYIGQTPTAVPLVAGDITDGIISEAKLAADAVSLAKMKAGTDGNIISYDASGNPVAIATGTSGQVLTSGGAGVAPTFATLADSGWEYVSTATASTSASLAFTNMVIGYDYEYMFDSIKSATDAVGFEAELGIAGPTYRTTNYECSVKGINDSAVSQSGEYTDRIEILDSAAEQLGTGTNEQLGSGYLRLNNPTGTTNLTSWFGKSGLYGSYTEMVNQESQGLYLTAEAHTSIKFACSSGNIKSGNILQYRRSRS